MASDEPATKRRPSSRAANTAAARVEAPSPAPEPLDSGVASMDAKSLAGRSLGRYRLLRHLDTGGMAEIFLGRHEAPGGFRKDLVLKILQPRFQSNRQVVEMFLDEARLAAKLDHPNIVEVFDVGEEVIDGGGVHYIAMEHIEGKTLTDLVRRGIEVGRPLPIAHAAHIVAQVADGLGYMWNGRDADGNRFGIVHRDISPSNIIIGNSGQTRIIDFGIATDRAASKEEEAPRPGKYSYMSPEQVKGAAVDGRSDIFSLGILLYEITLGRRLYRGQPQVVMKRIVEEPVRPPSFVKHDYPPGLELIVMRALEKRPEDRYASADDLYSDLEAFLSEQPERLGNRQVAAYMQSLEAAANDVSDRARRRALAFVPGDEDAPEDDEGELDLDARSEEEEWRHEPRHEPTPVRRPVVVPRSTRPPATAPAEAAADKSVADAPSAAAAVAASTPATTAGSLSTALPAAWLQRPLTLLALGAAAGAVITEVISLLVR